MRNINYGKETTSFHFICDKNVTTLTHGKQKKKLSKDGKKNPPKRKLIMLCNLYSKASGISSQPQNNRKD